MIAGADDRTAWRFVDFFAVTIGNPNTREAYYRAVSRFMDWCEQHGLHHLGDVMPIHVAAYVGQLPNRGVAPGSQVATATTCPP